ncbi:MAG: hypothetical protein LBC03_04335 [Nitrososphaerota archaeon]|nr:hypothetical protein [Nitrososphaerota archaeon]
MSSNTPTKSQAYLLSVSLDTEKNPLSLYATYDNWTKNFFDAATNINAAPTTTRITPKTIIPIISTLTTGCTINCSNISDNYNVCV